MHHSSILLLFDEHEFVAGKQCLEKVLKSFLLRRRVLHAVRRISLGRAMQEGDGAVCLLLARRTAIDGQESLLHVISLRSVARKQLGRQAGGASPGEWRVHEVE